MLITCNFQKDAIKRKTFHPQWYIFKTASILSKIKRTICFQTIYQSPCHQEVSIPFEFTTKVQITNNLSTLNHKPKRLKFVVLCLVV